MARIFQRQDRMRDRSFIATGLLPAILLVFVVAALLAAAWPDAGGGSDETAQVAPPPRSQVGLASFYGPGLHGNRTASGARFDQRKLTAAHRTLPLGTRVRVTNLENGASVVVVINDRGPYGRSRRKGAIIDVSRGAAARLDFIADGLARVRLEVIEGPGVE
jgi:rare lipoprotein A